MEYQKVLLVIGVLFALFVVSNWFTRKIEGFTRPPVALNPERRVNVATPFRTPTPTYTNYATNNDGMVPSSFMYEGRDHLYQIPQNPRGTVVAFHGCSRPAKGFWPFHAKYNPKGLGFPEDMSHAKQALRKGYAFLVLDPTDTRTYCWSGKTDWPLAVGALEKFLRDHKLLGKPVFTIGASAGGKFALNMQHKLSELGKNGIRIRGVINTVSTKAEIEGFVVNQAPVVHVIMNTGEMGRAQAQMAQLKARKVPTALVMTGPKKVTPYFFSDRMPIITPQNSALMVQALQAGPNPLIASDGTVKYDPKDYENKVNDPKSWIVSLKNRLPKGFFDRPGMSLSFNTSGIWQTLLNAYANHESVGEYTTAALEWFARGPKVGKAGEDDFALLAKKHRVENPASLKI